MSKDQDMIDKFEDIRKRLLLLHKLKGTSLLYNSLMEGDFGMWVNNGGSDYQVIQWEFKNNCKSAVNLFYSHIIKVAPEITKLEVRNYLVHINFIKDEYWK